MYFELPNIELNESSQGNIPKINVVRNSRVAKATITGVAPPTTPATDWVINQDTVVSGETIILPENSSIIVEPTVNFTVINSVIKFNLTSDGAGGIVIQSNASGNAILKIVDSVLINATIYHWYMNVTGTLYADNATFAYVSNATADGTGIYAEQTADITLIDCDIYGSPYTAFNAYNVSAFYMEGCKIHDNDGYALKLRYQPSNVVYTIKNSEFYNSYGVYVYSVYSLLIENSDFHDFEMNLSISNSGNLTMKNCEIYNNDKANVKTGGLNIYNVQGLIENCTFHDNGVTSTYGFGLYSLVSRNLIIRNCKAYNNMRGGFRFGVSGGTGNYNITLENCLSYSNGFGGIHFEGVKSGVTLPTGNEANNDIFVINCTAYGNSYDLVIADGFNITVQGGYYNKFFIAGVHSKIYNIKLIDLDGSKSFSYMGGTYGANFTFKYGNLAPLIYENETVISYPNTPTIFPYPYNITTASLVDQYLYITLTAPSGTESTVKIYCGDYKTPTYVIGGEYYYNSTSNIIEINVTHSSPQNIVVSWEDFEGIKIQQLTNGNITSCSFTNQRLHVVLEGPTGVTGTTVIYCPYNPIVIYENGELKTTNYTWNPDTKLLTVNVTFSSPVKLDIYFAIPKLESYDVKGEFLGYVFPRTQTIELNLQLYSEAPQVSQDVRIILEVYNMDGVLIYSSAKRETLTQEIKTVTFNIPDLEPGMYIVKVILKNPETGETLNTYTFLLKVTYPWWIWLTIILAAISVTVIIVYRKKKRIFYLKHQIFIHEMGHFYDYYEGF
jgi:hypothetical protein